MCVVLIATSSCSVIITAVRLSMKLLLLAAEWRWKGLSYQRHHWGPKRSIPIDSHEILVFLKTSCGWDFNKAFIKKENSLAVIADSPTWCFVYSCVYSRNILSQPYSQEQSQAGFGIATEPGDELPDVQENKSVGFSNRWCNIPCAFGHFTKWASSIILTNVINPFQLIHFHI